jgi:CysZ protein
MLKFAGEALEEVLTPPFRAVLYKSLALTLAILALGWIFLDKLILAAWQPPYAWLAVLLAILTGVGLVVAMIFLVAPVSSLVAGFFLDDVAEIVERKINPGGIPGKRLPTGQAIWLAVRFAAVSLLVNALAFLLWFFPGVNVIAFLAANAYLLGREYFELAAMRFRPVKEAQQLRQQNFALVLFGGLLIAVFVAVPIINLATPLFGTALMVRVHMRMMRTQPPLTQQDQQFLS